jgi:DNA-binding MarR family transcriptional regulator
MNSISQDSLDNGRSRRRLVIAIRQAMRELVTQLSLLNQQVGGHLDLRPIDIHCLDLLASYGPLSPSVLARRAGLHPATMTGILDRLERGRWITRDRDPADRRGVLIRILRDRSAEMLGLYAGMSKSMDKICVGYTDQELELLTSFLHRTAEAGQAAVGDLTTQPPDSGRTT